MKNKVLLLTLISIIIITGCSNDKQKKAVESWAIPVVESFGNYLVVGDEILNKDYIVRIGKPIDRAIYSGRKLNGYGLDVVLRTNTSSGFFGGSATATRIRLFFGTYEECITIRNQIIELLKEEA